MAKLGKRVATLAVLAALTATGMFSIYADQSAPVGRMESLLQQAEQGDANAQVMLGLYYNGLSTQKDYPQAIAWFRKSAEQGNALAEHNLGQSYRQGLGVPKDLDQAVGWFRKAAEHGHTPARQLLRSLFVKWEIVPAIDDQAGPWWRKLVDQANAEKQSFERFRNEAEQGANDAKVNLGIDYLTGVGTPKDRNKATELFRKAADHGHVEAQCLLGAITISNSDFGVPGENQRVAELCIKAANEGYADAQLILSTLYSMGRGVPKDKGIAAAWCRKAAGLGRSDAEYLLGILYSRGDGVPKDEAQANVWYRKAADQGYANALYSLGLTATLTHTTEPMNQTDDGRVMLEIGTEHMAENERELLPNLWASPSTKTREEQMRKELVPKIQQAADKANKSIVDSIYSPKPN